jgi:hypothetical protein
MLRSNRTLIVGLGLVAALAAGLAPSASTLSASDGMSTPVVARIAPAEPTAGKVPQTMTIAGQDFQPRLVLNVRTPEGVTQEYKDDMIVMRTEASFRVTMAFETPGKYSFVVTNTDGGVSDPYLLEVKAPATKPELPIIERIQPDEITKNAEAQNLTVSGQRFGPGLRAIVTDPTGVEVLDPVIRELTPTSFTLNVKLENAGTYSVVLSTAAGAVSNQASFIVR